MKAKKYRLQKVLEIRNRAQEESARIVALRFQQLEQAEEELNRRQKWLQACYEKQNQAQLIMDEDLNKGIQANNILRHRNYLDDLRKVETELKADVEKQIQIVAKAEKEVEAAREKLLESSRELKTIEIHKTKWQTTERIEQNRQEQKISNEIGAILHNRRKTS